MTPCGLEERVITGWRHWLKSQYFTNGRLKLILNKSRSFQQPFHRIKYKLAILWLEKNRRINLLTLAFERALQCRIRFSCFIPFSFAPHSSVIQFWLAHPTASNYTIDFSRLCRYQFFVLFGWGIRCFGLSIHHKYLSSITGGHIIFIYFKSNQDL